MVPWTYTDEYYREYARTTWNSRGVIDIPCACVVVMARK
jgi:hypothetical protein